MNIVQEDILKRVISHYKETGINSFDSSTFNTVENLSLKELERMGFVSISDDILETISLTDETLSKISIK